MAAAHDSPKNQPLILSSADFDFSANSTAVVSEAYKFVIPVPDLGEAAEPLVYPSGHAQAGEPIVDYKGQKIGDRGLVFFNDKDQAYQAVLADGSGVIIINEVQPEQAIKIDEKVRSLASNPGTLLFDHIKVVLAYARIELSLSDAYNSTRSYVAEKLTAIDLKKMPRSDSLEPYYGLKKRNNEDIYHAIYVPDSFTLKGITATEQMFPKGGIVLEHQGESWGVQPEVFISTYRLADGQPINLEQEFAKKSYSSKPLE